MVKYRVLETYKDKDDLELRVKGETYEITNKRAAEINTALGRDFVAREDSFEDQAETPEVEEETAEQADDQVEDAETVDEPEE